MTWNSDLLKRHSVIGIFASITARLTENIQAFKKQNQSSSASSCKDDEILGTLMAHWIAYSEWVLIKIPVFTTFIYPPFRDTLFLHLREPQPWNEQFTRYFWWRPSRFWDKRPSSKNDSWNSFIHAGVKYWIWRTDSSATYWPEIHCYAKHVWAKGWILSNMSYIHHNRCSFEGKMAWLKADSIGWLLSVRIQFAKQSFLINNKFIFVLTLFVLSKFWNKSKLYSGYGLIYCISYIA